MILNLLFSDPVVFLAMILTIFYVITVHEFSHAFAAYLAGDNTAKDYGRLTFNPLSHIDLTGFFTLLLAGFGWGKPTPINPANFKKPRRDLILVSLAGPMSNLISSIVFFIVLKYLVIFGNFSSGNLLITFLVLLVEFNAMLFIFNLLPIPPLDGSKILFGLLPDKFNQFKINYTLYGPWILLGLVFLDIFMNIGFFQSLSTFVINLIYNFI
jgi:Zn-dependent protease